MKRIVMAMLAATLTAVPIGAAQEPEVDTAEVLRLGNLVQHIDGIGSDPADRFVEAMGPPASDADKWFISVLSMRGCAACQKLKRDWATNPWLLALADPHDPKKSWAHYNVYLREDRSQAFRFENIRVTAYPTILVQPPRSGRYGEASTVVYQGTYGGDPEGLARQITEAIRRYLAKLEAVPPAPRGFEDTLGSDPPWQPTPQLDPPSPVAPVFPDGRPLIPPGPPPDATPQSVGPWGAAGTAALTSLLTLLLALGVPWALKTYRQYRIDSGRRPLLSGEQFQTLVEILSTAATASTQPSAKPNPSERPSAPPPA